MQLITNCTCKKLYMFTHSVKYLQYLKIHLSRRFREFTHDKYSIKRLIKIHYQEYFNAKRKKINTYGYT